MLYEVITIAINRWMPANKGFKPQVSNNYSLGLSKNFNDIINISTELYYRYMDNLTETLQDMRILTVDKPGEFLYKSEGEAYGSELFISYTGSRLNVITTFDFSKVMWLTNGLNNNMPYPASHVRRNNFNITASYQLSELV